jgi:repressor LexA
MALQVRGSGMADEGLRDGDRLIVERRATAVDGQTVVAEVDGKLTVKRAFRDARGRIRLRPANPEMLPLALSPARHRIIGVLVGISRRQSAGGAGPLRPRIEAAERPLDLTMHVIDQSIRQAETLAAVRSGAARARLQELAQSLCTLRDCYVDARTAKLRAALLREAGALVRRVRQFDSERPQEPALGLA